MRYEHDFSVITLVDRNFEEQVSIVISLSLITLVFLVALFTG